MNYRCETAVDIPQVHAVVEAAFQRAAEADLVNTLRAAGHLVLSVVAEQDGRVFGHAAFSPVRVGDTLVRALGLGPLAVLPGFQKQGVGAGLVVHGLRWADELGADAVFVLGDPPYYRRFGFRPAITWDIHWEHPALAEHFQRAGTAAQRAGGPCGRGSLFRGIQRPLALQEPPHRLLPLRPIEEFHEQLGLQ